MKSIMFFCIPAHGHHNPTFPVVKELVNRGNTVRFYSLSTTDMTIVDLQSTAKMDSFLQKEVEEFKPDIIVSDSVCFWGKLTARKYKIPMVVSTTTFAFNKQSASYMKSSFAEIMDLIKGQKRVKAELKNLEQHGYHEKSIIDFIRNLVCGCTDDTCAKTSSHQVDGNNVDA